MYNTPEKSPLKEHLTIMRRRKVWHHQHVVDTVGPQLIMRTYLEQSDVRAWLSRISHEINIEQACDVGAGYGRLTPVLTEFAPHVVAFEREQHFVDDIQHLLPQVAVHQIESLAQLPVPDGAFQAILVFTVLQHLTDDELGPTIEELKRILAHPGYILLCEETDSDLHYSEDDSPEGGTTIGRPINQYQTLLNPLTLVSTAPRRVEPSNPNTGTYMLFART